MKKKKKIYIFLYIVMYNFSEYQLYQVAAVLAMYWI